MDADGGGAEEPVRASGRSRVRYVDPAPEHRLTEEEITAELGKWDAWLWQQARNWHKIYRDVELEDFRSAAVVGFLVGARRFDKSRGMQLTTYAGWYVRNECQSLVFRSRGEGIRRHDLKLKDLKNPASLDAASTEGTPYAASIPDHREPEPERSVPDDFWDRVARVLPTERHLVVLRARLAGDTLEAIGKRLGITKERVRQIHSDAIGWLRDSPEIDPSWLDRE